MSTALGIAHTARGDQGLREVGPLAFLCTGTLSSAPAGPPSTLAGTAIGPRVDRGRHRARRPHGRPRKRLGPARSFCSWSCKTASTSLTIDNPVLGTDPSMFWDSGTMINANGNTFSLYLLPMQPSNTFTSNLAGTSTYEEYIHGCWFATAHSREGISDREGISTVVTTLRAKWNCIICRCVPEVPDVKTM